MDDHGELRDLLRRAFTREGYRVTCAKTLADADQQLRLDPPDGIILDLGLPDGDGVDFCRSLRRRQDDTPVLMLTAQGEVGQRVEGLDAGADDFLPKPFEIAELRARVRAMLRRAQHELSPTVIRSGEVALDLAKCIAVVSENPDAKEVPMTAREWSILRLLASRKGRVVNRVTILEAIWGDIDDGSNASLDVLITRIRRKLGSSLIRTVRGEGYAIEL